MGLSDRRLLIIGITATIFISAALFISIYALTLPSQEIPSDDFLPENQAALKQIDVNAINLFDQFGEIMTEEAFVLLNLRQMADEQSPDMASRPGYEIKKVFSQQAARNNSEYKRLSPAHKEKLIERYGDYFSEFNYSPKKAHLRHVIEVKTNNEALIEKNNNQSIADAKIDSIVAQAEKILLKMGPAPLPSSRLRDLSKMFEAALTDEELIEGNFTYWVKEKPEIILEPNINLPETMASLRLSGKMYGDVLSQSEKKEYAERYLEFYTRVMGQSRYQQMWEDAKLHASKTPQDSVAEPEPPKAQPYSKSIFEFDGDKSSSSVEVAAERQLDGEVNPKLLIALFPQPRDILEEVGLNFSEKSWIEYRMNSLAKDYGGLLRDDSADISDALAIQEANISPGFKLLTLEEKRAAIKLYMTYYKAIMAEPHYQRLWQETKAKEVRRREDEQGKKH